jgi:hypothetical protein
MKRFIYSAVAFASLAATSSNPVMGGEIINGDHYGNGHEVLICHSPYGLRIEITVKVKDLADYLAQGDILGSCPVGPVGIVG